MRLRRWHRAYTRSPPAMAAWRQHYTPQSVSIAVTEIVTLVTTTTALSRIQQLAVEKRSVRLSRRSRRSTKPAASSPAVGFYDSQTLLATHCRDLTVPRRSMRLRRFGGGHARSPPAMAVTARTSRACPARDQKPSRLSRRPLHSAGRTASLLKNQFATFTATVAARLAKPSTSTGTVSFYDSPDPPEHRCRAT